MRTLLLVAMICAVSSFVSLGGSDLSMDSDARVVYLREDCSPGGVQIENCKETMAELLTSGSGGWLWATRQPGPDDRLVIDIGPGTFANFACRGSATAPRGWVTLRGAGRERTSIVSTILFQSPVDVRDCDGLAFESLTILNEGTPSIDTVFWRGSGTAIWSDVDIISRDVTGTASHAWYDEANSTSFTVCNEPSVHYFFDSNLRAFGAAESVYAWGGNCSDAWFFGGELRTHLDEITSLDPGKDGCEANNIYSAHQVHAFGTEFHLIVDVSRSSPNRCFPIGSENPNFTNNASLIPNVWLFGYSDDQKPQMHVHGGLISSVSTASNVDIGGVVIDGAGTDNFLHTPDTAHHIEAHALKTAYRSLTTVPDGEWRLESPHHWGVKDDTPPGNVRTVDGSDAYVESDCDVYGTCDAVLPADRRSHLLLYDATRCPSDIWFNVSTAQCRGETTDSFQNLVERVDALEGP